MNRKTFAACAAEVAAYTDRNDYISDMALSSLWGDTPEAEIPQSRIDELGQVWDAVNRPVREIVAHTGLSQAAFASLYLIPRRTVEDWCREIRQCPLYTRLLLQEAAGILTLEK